MVEYRVRWNQQTVRAYLLETLAVAAVLTAVAADGAAVVGDEESTKADAETTPYSNCNDEEDGLGGKGEEVEGKEDDYIVMLPYHCGSESRLGARTR